MNSSFPRHFGDIKTNSTSTGNTGDIKSALILATTSGKSSSTSKLASIRSEPGFSYHRKTTMNLSETTRQTNEAFRMSHLATESEIFSGNLDHVRGFSSHQNALNVLEPQPLSKLSEGLSSLSETSQLRILPSVSPSTSRIGPTTAFDKLAFKAVSKAFDDLQERGILVISENSANEEAPFHLSANVARFFMTEQQADEFGQRDPESWPKLPHSEALRQDYHTKFGPSTGSRTSDSASKKAEMRPVFSEDCAPSSPPSFLEKDTQRDNKVLTMLKFMVKYTNHNVKISWVRKFLNRPLAAEVRELQVVYNQLKLWEKMEKYWTNLQKQRYDGQFAWRYRLAPINANVWFVKHTYKIRHPSRYLRQKVLWHTICQEGGLAEGICPSGDHTSAVPGKFEMTTHVSDDISYRGSVSNQSAIRQASLSTAVGSSATSALLDDAFTEWVKNSGANLSVTISYAWNELKADGFPHREVPESYQIKLMGALVDLETNIRLYGVGDKPLGQDAAVTYAGVVLRFTQALHDYLEVKDRDEEACGRLIGWSKEAEECYEDLLTEYDRPLEPKKSFCVCYKCRAAFADGTAECPCDHCDTTVTSDAVLQDSSLDRQSDSPVSQGCSSESEIEHENSQTFLHHSGNTNGQPSPLDLADHIAEDMVTDETHANLLRSARLRFHEQDSSTNVASGTSKTALPDITDSELIHEYVGSSSSEQILRNGRAFQW